MYIDILLGQINKTLNIYLQKIDKPLEIKERTNVG